MEISYTAIIILNYNNAPDTANLLDSILEHNTAPVKIVVVDNASTKEGTVSELKGKLESSFGSGFVIIDGGSDYPDAMPECTLILNGHNDGYARGNNVGLEYAERYDQVKDILILNNDTLFMDDIIPILQKEREHLDAAGLISPLLFCKDGESIDYNCARKVHSNWEIILSIAFLDRDPFGILSRLSDKRKLLLDNPDLLGKDSFEIGMPSGSCMLIKKDLMQEIGNFDPGTFLYYEENILQAKLRRLGRKNYIVPSARCIHIGASTTRETPDIFLSLCRFDSACHYMRNHADMTVMQQVCFAAAERLYKLKERIRRKIRGR